MHYEGHLARRGNLLALLAVVVGVKNEGVVLNILEKNHTHIRQPVGVNRRKRDRVWVIWF